MAVTFALIFLLLLSVIAYGKPPTLEYRIIRRNNNAPPSTMHPPPVNDPTRGCNAENFCRHFTLSIQSPSGTRVEAVAKVEMGPTLNKSSEAGVEAIASGIVAWTLNKTNGNAYKSLSVSGDPTSSAELLAFSRRIATMKFKTEYRSAQDVASLPLVDGRVIITVDAAANQVALKFFTQVRSLGKTDIIYIMEHAKVAILK